MQALGSRQKLGAWRGARSARGPGCRHKVVAWAQSRDEGSTLDALESLGIGADGASTSTSTSTSGGAAQRSDEVIWWQARPRQAAPPRQGLLSSDAQGGRFINEGIIGLTGSTRTGRTTPVGGELDVPQVEPFWCYWLLGAQLAVYGLGTWVGATQGVDASSAMALELALLPSAVLAEAPNSEWWRLASCLLLHTGMPHLVLSTFGLSYLGPDAEALLGHGPFVSIALLSGLTAAATTLLLGPDVATAGATGALMGVIGAMAGYESSNKELRSYGALGRGPRRQVGTPWGAAALAGCVLLLGAVPGVNSGVLAVDCGGQLAGLVAGAWLGYSAGPKFTVARELDIPDGAMHVPHDAKEVAVVLDTRGGAKKALALGAYGAALVGVIAAVGALRTYVLP